MSLNMKMESNLKAAGAYREYEQYRRLKIISYAVLAFEALLAFLTAWPMQMVLDGKFEKIPVFYQVLGQVFTGQLDPIKFIIVTYGGIIRQAWTEGVFGLKIVFPLPLLFWGGVLFVTALAFTAANKHRRTPNIFGDTRWSNADDIEAMASQNLVGFEDSKTAPKSLFILGKFQDRMVRMGETLSILLLAPPGTGKSVGFIVPSILELDKCSIFVHDQKPELWDMTVGHRSKVGPCFLLKWAAQDEPNGAWINEAQRRVLDDSVLQRNADGSFVKDENGYFRTKPRFFPSWNPLSPKCMPPLGVSRDMYLDRMSQTLSPDSTGPGGDKFWTSKARQALTGFTHFLSAKIEACMDPAIAWRWDGIPEQWHGREPSYPMMVDWLAYGQTAFEADDPMAAFLKACVDEARELDAAFFEKRGIRPMNRVIVELSSLMSTPDKTRGSIMTTFDDAMAPFKMESVRQRTSASDIAFYELRGIPSEEARAREAKKVEDARKDGRTYKPRYAEGEWLPVSVYISVDLENAKAFSTITSIFIDSANAYLVANGPNMVDEQGNQVGPYPFGFLIDEAPQLGKLDTIVNGPAVGRSKKVFYVIVGQDFGQFEQKYSKPEVSTLKSTTAIKIVLTQNNEETAKQISEMAGRMTFQKTSFSDKPRKGIEGFIFGKGKSASESWESVEFLRPATLMSLQRGKHIVLVQNFMNRPILCDTPRYFEEKTARKGKIPIAEKGLNLQTGAGPRAGMPMPQWLMEAAAKRLKDFEEGRKRASPTMPPSEQAGSQAVAQQALQRKDDGRRVVVVTPTDVAAMARDEDSCKIFSEEKRPFLVYVTKCSDKEDGIEPPSPDEIMRTYDPLKVVEAIGDSVFWIYSEAQLDEELNAPLIQAGKKPISTADGQVVIVQRIAESLGERSIEDYYLLGAQGGPAQRFHVTGEDPDQHFVMNWVCEVISFLIYADIRSQLYDDPDPYIAEFMESDSVSDHSGEGSGASSVI